MPMSNFPECFLYNPIGATQFRGFLWLNSFKWFSPGPEFTSNPRNLTAMTRSAQKQF